MAKQRNPGILYEDMELFHFCLHTSTESRDRVPVVQFQLVGFDDSFLGRGIGSQSLNSLSALDIGSRCDDQMGKAELQKLLGNFKSYAGICASDKGCLSGEADTLVPGHGCHWNLVMPSP